MSRVSRAADRVASRDRHGGLTARARALRQAWLDGTLDLSVDLEGEGMDRLVAELFGADAPARPPGPRLRRQ